MSQVKSIEGKVERVGSDKSIDFEVVSDSVRLPAYVVAYANHSNIPIGKELHGERLSALNAFESGFYFHAHEREDDPHYNAGIAAREEIERRVGQTIRFDMCH